MPVAEAKRRYFKNKSEINIEIYRKLFKSIPFPILIYSKDGYVIDSTDSMTWIVENYTNCLSNLKPELVKKVIDEKKETKIVVNDKKNSRFYMVSLRPFEFQNEIYCLCVIEDISNTVKLNSLLNFSLNIYRFLNSTDISKVVKKLLTEFYILNGTKVELFLKIGGKFRPLIFEDYPENCLLITNIETVNSYKAFEIKCNCKNTSCPNYGNTAIVFPLISDDRSVKGFILFYFCDNFLGSKKEISVLESISRLIEFFISRAELEDQKRKAYNQLIRNVENYAILIDHIRNPLSVILGISELFIDDAEIKKTIMAEINKIEKVVSKLDKGWLESETVLEFLRRHGC